MELKNPIHFPLRKKIPIARKRLYYFLLLFVLVVFFAINQPGHRLTISELFPPKSAWEKIQRKQKVIAITRTNYSDYHLNNGNPVGLQFDMLKAFCADHSIEFELIVEDDFSKVKMMLQKNKAQILCSDYSDFEQEHLIKNTYAYRSTNFVVLQRKNSNDGLFANSLLDLNNKKLYLKKGSISTQLIQDTLNILNLKCSIIEDSIQSLDSLINQLLTKKINFLLCNEVVAKQYLRKFQSLRSTMVVGENIPLCWMVKSGEDSLLTHINTWLVDFVQSKKFKSLKRKYDNLEGKNYRNEKNYVSLHEGKISVYDEIFKKEAIKLGWDWRLLASLSYEESHFNPNAQNWSGAVGMMQLMPETARRFGAKDPYDPVQNVRAGVKYLLYLDRILAQSISDKDERIYFVLAAYNLGPAHIIDAKNLAKKYGKNPNVWINQVDSCLILKAKPKYYQDDVVKSGYCNGQYTVDFVDNIFERYLHYCNIVQF